MLELKIDYTGRFCACALVDGTVHVWDIWNEPWRKIVLPSSNINNDCRKFRVTGAWLTWSHRSNFLSLIRKYDVHGDKYVIDLWRVSSAEHITSVK